MFDKLRLLPFAASGRRWSRRRARRVTLGPPRALRARALPEPPIALRIVMLDSWLGSTDALLGAPTVQVPDVARRQFRFRTSLRGRGSAESRNAVSDHSFCGYAPRPLSHRRVLILQATRTSAAGACSRSADGLSAACAACPSPHSCSMCSHHGISRGDAKLRRRYGVDSRDRPGGSLEWRRCRAVMDR